MRFEPTDDSPFVLLDAQTGKCEVKGKSLPEDVVAFYQPMINWLKEYEKTGQHDMEFTFNLVYFNTASSKQILDIMVALEGILLAGKKVLVKWYSVEDDEEMQEAGHEYAEMVSIPFEHFTYIP